MKIGREWRLVAVLVLAMALVPVAPLAAQTVEPEMVISGLNNPRGLDFDGDTLYLAEAGVGGAGPCVGSAEGGQMCYGETGAIVALADASTQGDVVAGDSHRLVANLPSLAPQEDDPATPQPDAGTSATGPHDVSVRPDGETLLFPVGLGGDLALREQLGEAGSAFATLRQVDADGTDLLQVADLGQFEADHNPDQDVIPDSVVDTNPYSVIARETDAVVADAGGNDLLRVGADGSIEVMAVFPPLFVEAPPFLELPPGTAIPSQPVPTGIAGGETDADPIYVGSLTGFPFQMGSAPVFAVQGGQASVAAPGFTNVIDVAVAPDGDLYVLEIAHNSLLTGDLAGALYRVSPDGATKDLLLDDLFMPGGITFGPDGQAYISNCSVCTGEGGDPAVTGHVLRYDAVVAEPLLTVTAGTAETTEDQPVLLPVDAAGEGEVSVAAVTGSGNGAVSRTDDGLRYQPAAHFSGTDTVTYRVCDAAQHCADAAVRIAVAETPTDRIAGAGRVETAVRTSRAVFPGGAQAVVVARADAYPDALAGSVLARAADAPLLLTGSDVLSPATAAEINRLGASSAYVLGGTAAISEATAQAIAEATGVETVTRVSGATRWDTAAAIKASVAELTGEPATAVYVAEGEDADPDRGFPDALAVSALAAHQLRPILLVATDVVPEATAAALEGVSAATVVGGTDAVSEAVAETLAAAVGDVDRVGGANRYETSAQLAQASVDAGLDASTLWLTTGQNWPDALTTGPSVARDAGVLVLVHPTDADASQATLDFIESSDPVADVDIVGGMQAVSAEVEQAIRAVLAG